MYPLFCLAASGQNVASAMSFSAYVDGTPEYHQEERTHERRCHCDMAHGLADYVRSSEG